MTYKFDSFSILRQIDRIYNEAVRVPTLLTDSEDIEDERVSMLNPMDDDGDKARPSGRQSYEALQDELEAETPEEDDPDALDDSEDDPTLAELPVCLSFPIILDKASWLNGTVANMALEKSAFFSLEPHEVTFFEGLRAANGRKKSTQVTPEASDTKTTMAAVVSDEIDTKSIDIDAIVAFSQEYQKSMAAIDATKDPTGEHRTHILTELAKVF